MPDKSPFIPYGRQTIDDNDIAAVVDVLRSDFLTSGPTVDAFETALCKQTGAEFGIACSSGTAALHLAAMALDLGPGDWAIVPAITFLATANAIRYTGADVIFADVDPDNGLLSAATLEAALSTNSDKKIRAVLPVHLAGQPTDMESIAAIAHRNGLAIIEDASHALGTSYPDPVGKCAHSDMAVFSFHPVKTVASGEGGAVMTNNPELNERLCRFRNHGMTRTAEDFANTEMAFDTTGAANPWYYEMAEPGYNYRLTDIQAALGLSQLGKLGLFAKERRRIVAHYDERLADLAPRLRPISRTPGCTVAWHLYPVLFDFDELGLSRAEVMTRLRDMGIGSQVHYIPVSSQPYYTKLYGAQSLPGADAYYGRTLSLPLYPVMSGADVERVAVALESIMGTTA